MTAPNDPATAAPDELELVSAYLDGEAAAEDAARVEGDPRLRSLAERLGSVSRRLRVDSPSTGLVDAHVSAALDAFDEGPATAPVVDLSAERRRRWYDRVPLGAVAAALVVVALVGAATQVDLGTGRDDEATATGDAATDETALLEDSGDDGEGAFDAEAQSGAGAGGAADGAPFAREGRAAFATTDELAAHVAEEVLGGAPTTTRTDAQESDDADDAAAPDESTGYDAGSACDAMAASSARGAPVLAVVPAVLAGRDVTAIVVDEGSVRRLIVVDDADCVVVDDREI